MTERNRDEFFTGVKDLLEPIYMTGETPWNQSGFSGTEERWNRLRRPIAACIDRSGTYLDIGCANGYLMECVARWTEVRGLQVTPHGLDISEELVKLAQRRLPAYADRLYAGNAWEWTPPQTFDFVSTELVYVPEDLRQAYIERLLNLFVAEDGLLLLSEYRPTKEADNPNWASEYIEAWGYPIDRIESGIDLNGKELTRVTVISKR
ncbi:MAG TPA: class I SAM-dependent methyltransferase [Bacilli bacterium]|nr:class I SAM-dependent methyltransferase [Bacilli bacterium]